MITQDEISKAAQEFSWHEMVYENFDVGIISFCRGANWAISKQQAECEELRRKLGIAVEALENIGALHLPEKDIRACGGDAFLSDAMIAREALEQLNKPTEVYVEHDRNACNAWSETLVCRLENFGGKCSCVK